MDTVLQIVKKKILLVEDDLINQIAVKKFLQKLYDVLSTDNSESAIEITNGQNIDLILMDISIRGQLNGLELTEYLRKSEGTKNIPIIALTAYAFSHDRENCMKSGCSDYLAKPYSREELLNKIALYLQ